MDREETVCHCMGVNYGEIMNAIETGNLKTIEEVGEATGAGTGCGGCQDMIQDILNEFYSQA
ncbi:MAG: (2Fe-2S)-binding protein [Bacteroidales bacterium]|jgi:NAD(P)H-nitrite reductase large subunit|nr:(2Fe-2S)-binding protein [Bacteroidales bacterium]